MFFYGNEDFYGSYIGIKGEIVVVGSTDSQRHILSMSSDGAPSFQIEMAGPLYPLELDKDRVDWMLGNGLREVSDLLAKRKLNSFESFRNQCNIL